MLESYLLENCQGAKDLYGKVSAKEIAPDISFTDPCLDWKSTEHLIQEGAKLLRDKHLRDKKLQDKAKNVCTSYSYSA